MNSSQVVSPICARSSHSGSSMSTTSGWVLAIASASVTTRWYVAVDQQHLGLAMVDDEGDHCRVEAGVE